MLKQLLPIVFVATSVLSCSSSSDDSGGDNITDIAASLPYSGTLSNNISQKYKVTGGVVGTIYVVTLATTTPGTTIDLELYSDSTYQYRFDYNNANILQDAISYVEAQTSTLYMLIGDTFQDGGTYDFVINVQDYDTYAGLIDISGAYPYSGTTAGEAVTPYQITGLEANATYTITFSNVTNNISMIGTNDKMKMIDGSYIPCSAFINSGGYICTVTTTVAGEIYIKMDNSSANPVNYDIDISL